MSEKIKCPSCGHPIIVQVFQVKARCTKCHTVFFKSIEAEIEYWVKVNKRAEDGIHIRKA